MLELLKSKPENLIKKRAKPFRRIGTEHVLQVDGVEISVWEVQGEKPPLIFVHGNSACKEVFHHQVSAFAKNGHAIAAIDLPGHGASANAVMPETQYTIPGYALIIKKVLDKLSLSRPLLIGWSLGGHIAIEMIGRGFDAAGALIVGTPPAGPGMADFEHALLPSPFMSVTMNEHASEDDIRLYTQNLYGALDPIPELFFDAGLRTDGRARRIMGAHWAQGEEGCHQRTVAAGTDRPICLVHGMDDPFISYNYLKSVEWRSLWSGKFFELEGVGHAAFIEAPNKFNEILSAFSKGVFEL